MKPLAAALAVAAVALCVACASGPVLDDYLAGWQSQRDGHVATFVHRNFEFQRRVEAERAGLERSGALDWAAYAKPALAAATRSRSIFIDRGRADTLDEFLAHMGADPAAEATTQWFAAEERRIGDAAEKAGAQAGTVLSDLTGPLRPGESWSKAMTALAAEQGTVRGRALALVELRRSAALYYGDIGYDKSTLGFYLPADTVGAAPTDGALVERVESRARWAEVREALVAPRRCERTGAAVTCAPAAAGAATASSGASEPAPDAAPAAVPPAPPPADEPMLPGNDMNRIPTTAPSTIDDANQRYGW